MYAICTKILNLALPVTQPTIDKVAKTVKHFLFKRVRRIMATAYK